MASLDFNNIKRWVFFILSAWALLAFIAWHYESTCGMFLSGACWAKLWDGARHVVLLKWVKEYQTLVAGILALGGGAFALFAAYYRQQWAEFAEKRKKKEAATLACSLVAAELELAAFALTYYKQFAGVTRDRDDYPFKQTPSQIAIICQINQNIGIFILERVEQFYQVMTDPNFRNTSAEKSMCRNAKRLLNTVATRLEGDGTVSTKALTELPDGEYLALRDIFR